MKCINWYFKQTPIEKHGDIYFKREDYWTFAGVFGAKARALAYLLSQQDVKKMKGIVSQSSRHSPQQILAAAIGKMLGKKVIIVTAKGQMTEETKLAKKLGAKIKHVALGYNNVLNKGARDWASKTGYFLAPFGMSFDGAVELTENQVKSIIPYKDKIKRIVIPCGSGINLAGLLRGLKLNAIDIPVIAVQSGANIDKVISNYFPENWRNMVVLHNPNISYSTYLPNIINGVEVDPIYEARCIPYLKKGDLFWIIGKRTYEKRN